MINMTIERKHVCIIATVGLTVPTNAWPLNECTDVPASNPCHDDIAWIADAGVWLGCGGGNYCPGDNVTREQMVAFMKRLATDRVVDAKEINGGTAWMWASTADGAINSLLTASPTFSYNSQGGPIEYARTAAPWCPQCQEAALKELAPIRGFVADFSRIANSLLLGIAHPSSLVARMWSRPWTQLFRPEKVSIGSNGVAGYLAVSQSDSATPWSQGYIELSTRPGHRSRVLNPLTIPIRWDLEFEGLFDPNRLAE